MNYVMMTMMYQNRWSNTPKLTDNHTRPGKFVWPHRRLCTEEKLDIKTVTIHVSNKYIHLISAGQHRCVWSSSEQTQDTHNRPVHVAMPTLPLSLLPATVGTNTPVKYTIAAVWLSNQLGLILSSELATEARVFSLLDCDWLVVSGSLLLLVYSEFHAILFGGSQPGSCNWPH